jgi:uncharacterized membrane protein (UPF0127 family)
MGRGKVPAGRRSGWLGGFGGYWQPRGGAVGESEPGQTGDRQLMAAPRARGRRVGIGTDWAIPTSWLLCEGVRVAPVTVASLPWELSVGLLGRDRTDEAILLETSFVIHTLGMRFPIDVAFCDRSLRVISVLTMGRNRVARPRLGCRVVVEAAAGTFQAWHLVPGSRLRVEDDP